MSECGDESQKLAVHRLVSLVGLRYIRVRRDWMNILEAVRGEERQIEKQLKKLQQRPDCGPEATQALGRSANHEGTIVTKRVLSPAGRARITTAATRRWAKVRRAKKATS
jgi:hypothetical protein